MLQPCVSGILYPDEGRAFWVQGGSCMEIPLWLLEWPVHRCLTCPGEWGGGQASPGEGFSAGAVRWNHPQSF